MNLAALRLLAMVVALLLAAERAPAEDSTQHATPEPAPAATLATAIGAPATDADASPSITLAPVKMRLIETGRSLPIDLPTVIRLAEANSLDILEAHARRDEAHGRRNEALGALLPEVTGTFRARKIDGMIQASFGQRDRATFSTLNPAVGVQLELNPAEALFDALAAHRALDAAEHESGRAHQDVLALATRQYFGLLAGHAQVRIAEQTLEASRELARIGRDRTSVGAGLKVDVLRAEAREGATAVRLVEAQRMLRRASLALALTLQLDPSVTLFPAETVVRQRTLIDPALPLDDLIERARTARPVANAEGQRLTAAEHEKSASLAEALGPTVFGSFEESAIGRSTGDLDNRQIYGGFIGLTLSPSSIGRVQAADARVEQARLAQTRVERRIAVEVISARDDVLTAQEQIAAAMRGLRAAEAALDLSQVRFKGGVGIGLEVLDAEAALSEARTNLVTAILAYDTSEIALLHAVGSVSASSLLAGVATPDGAQP